MCRRYASLIAIAAFCWFGAVGCSDPDGGAEIDPDANQHSTDTDGAETGDAGDTSGGGDARDAQTENDVRDAGSDADAGDVETQEDAQDTGGDEVGPDAAEPECDSDQMYCGGACRDCPTVGVAEVECDGEQCVASDCQTGYVTCQLGCCPTEPVLVDDAGDGGTEIDIEIDSQGMPHVIYDRQSQMPRHVQYARFDGEQWENSTIEGGNPDDDNKGRYLSMAIDSQDRIHVGYLRYSGAYPGARYAIQDGDDWQHESLQSVADGRSISIDVDDDDNPWIVHNAEFSSAVYLTSWDGDSWTDESVEINSQVEARHLDLVVDSENRPHVSGEEASAAGSGLYLSKQDPEGSWYAVSTVDGVGGTEIALDANEEPVIALHDDSASHRVRIARWDDIEFDIETVEDCQSCGWHVSMALDGQDRPHVAYRRYNGDDAVVYAHDDGSGWTHTAIAEGFWPESIALDVDEDGRAHIVYRDQDPSHIRYVVVTP